MNLKGVNVKNLQYITELLTEQMNHWLLFPFVMLVTTYARRIGDFNGLLIVLMWMICSLLPLAFFIVRVKAKSITAFLILQPVAALLPAGAAMTVQMYNGYMFRMGRLICIVCAVCYMFHSALLYFKKKDPFSDSIPLPAGVAIAGVCLALEFLADDDVAAGWTGYHIIPLIISIGLLFIILYLQRYIDFLNVNKSSAGYLPAAEMFHSGLGLVIGYTVFGVAVMILLACGPWLGRLGTALGNLLTNLFKWIVAKIKKTPAEDEIPLEKDYGQMSDVFPEFKINKTFWLWHVLEYVFLFMLLAVLLVMFVRGLIRLIQYLQRLSLSRIIIPDAEGEDAFDIHERCDMDGRLDRKKQGRFSPLSYSDRIRRLYKRKILSSTGQMTPGESKMLGIYTAREWEQKLSTQGMAYVYEQARYSEQEMSAEDVKRMKDACR